MGRFYVRTEGKKGGRKFEPLTWQHPLIGLVCAACGKGFRSGMQPTLVPVGPGEGEEDREKAQAGRPYNAVAVPVHWACATGEEDA